MASYQDIRLHLKALKYFGLLCFSYDDKRNLLHVTPTDKFYTRLVFCVIQFTMFSMLLYCIMHPSDFYLGVYNRTGNIYLCYEFCFCCILVAFISAFGYVKREKNLHTTQQLLLVEKETPLPERCRKNLKRVFGFYIILVILSSMNYTKAFWYSETLFRCFVCYSVLYSLNFSICGGVMVAYICKKRALKHRFFVYNKKLEQLLYNLESRECHSRFRELLICRYDLLSICRNDLNSSYGLVMLAISAYIVFSSPSGIFFFISVVLDPEPRGSLTKYNWALCAIMWNAPWLIMFSLLLGPNNIEDEWLISLMTVLFTMPLYQDMRLYLLTLKYLGLLCFSYDTKRDALRVTNADKNYAKSTLVILQVLVLILFVYCITKPTDFFLGQHNRTGNIYLCFDFGFSCLIMSFLSMYCYKKRILSLKVVQHLLNLHKDIELPQRCRSNLRRLYRFYVIFVIMCFQNYIKAFLFSHIPLTAVISYTVVLTLNFSLCGMVMSWYTGVERILKHHFMCVNNKLEKLLVDLKRQECRVEFRRLLRCRYELLSICRDSINPSYGLILLVISSYMVFASPSGFFFLISIVFEKNLDGYLDKYNSAFTALLWNVPWILIFISTLLGNELDQEANKTAKILSKVPRSGTGIEKMVQKFLLKNLRQKPILTAYGFFSLDKSTLFKLFTAIFTYMVILVQFKEMESSRKQLGQSN